MTQKISKQRAWKAQHEVTTGKGHVGHITHTVGSTIVKVQNIQNGKKRYMHHKL